MRQTRPNPKVIAAQIFIKNYIHPHIGHNPCDDTSDENLKLMFQQAGYKSLLEDPIYPQVAECLRYLCMWP